MKKRILALVLALTVSLCPVMTADAAMIVKNNMGALDTSNILDSNKTKIPKDSLQKIAAGYKINYSAEDLEALKKIFDVNIYAKAYPDVAKAYGNDREALWNHYITHGLKEGRTQINPAFNVFAYISAYPDLQNAFGDDLVAYYVHYANYGINENRKLTTIDAVTKAGITVSGMNGQVIAKPAVPESVLADPAEETISVPASVPESSKTESKPEATAAPSEAPKPSETPAPTEVPPAPKPSDPASKPEETCKHDDGFKYEILRDKTNMHLKTCKNCNYSAEEECTFNNGACGFCERQCDHKWNAGTGTCENCKMTCSHAEYSEWQSVDSENHKRICKNCQHEDIEAHDFSQGSTCTRCKAESSNTIT